MMTRKDFVALAQITATIKDSAERQAVAVAQARHFKARNPRFDTDRYLAACDVRAGAEVGV